MLFQLSWRNIWRNKVRSLVVVTAVTLGLWAGVFIMGFYYGVMEQKVRDVIELEISHLQIHHPKFKEEDFNTKYYIPHGRDVVESIRKDKRVDAVTGRMITMGMVTSTTGNAGVKIVGVIPDEEAKVNKLDTMIKDGAYFEGVSRNPVLMGKKMAEKLKVKVRSKVVLTFQDSHGTMVTGAFRIVGIYKTKNGMFDNLNLFVRQDDLKSLLGDQMDIHEVAILLHNNEDVDTLKKTLAATYPDLLVEDWLDIQPMMQYMNDVMDQFLTIFILIIMLALMFGIVNTMLMAVLERTRELGMLMAVGMNKKRIFTMIMRETIMLAFIGAVAGILFGSLTNYYFEQNGLNVGVFAETYEQVGFSTIVYPALELKHYLIIFWQVFLLTILGALYPAYRALKLNAVEAIRKI